ncbi:MAG: hypothetical protein U0325_13410 [Polyangiales bacterium]
MLVAPAHRVAPGVQVCATHMPALHAWPLGQGVADHESPSGEQVSTLIDGSLEQRVAPGMHTRATQAPSRHDSLLGHGVAAHPLPLSAQRSTRPSIAQRALRASQTRARHRLPGKQNSLAVQSLSPTHSTQTPCAGSQTNPRSEHCRDDMHARGRATQLPSAQRWVIAQSLSPMHSAHCMRAASQTSPVHWREEVQAVGATHRDPTQARPSAQSTRVRQSTQTPRARSQTPPGHALSVVQVVAETSPPTSEEAASVTASTTAASTRDRGTNSVGVQACAKSTRRARIEGFVLRRIGSSPQDRTPRGILDAPRRTCKPSIDSSIATRHG